MPLCRNSTFRTAQEWGRDVGWRIVKKSRNTNHKYLYISSIVIILSNRSITAIVSLLFTIAVLTRALGPSREATN